jgi:imidazoleglycerol-phosphate dehydratase/histidinol-phosphatase
VEITAVYLHFRNERNNAPVGFMRAMLQLDAFGFTLNASSPPDWLISALNAEMLSLAGEQTPGYQLIETGAQKFSLLDQHGHLLSEGDTIFEAVQNWLLPDRKAEIIRKTNETDIAVRVNLDGTGKAFIQTGLPFFDHMLEQIARHGLVDLTISCTGDLHIDEHHTIEDTAIALGACLAKAIGDKRGIERYSWALPMDETLALVSLDLSGRPYLQFEAELKREYVGDFPTEMTKHFFYSLAIALKATLQMRVSGENDHHKIEALFKGFARCLRGAVSRNPRIRSLVPSSKGVL